MKEVINLLEAHNNKLSFDELAIHYSRSVHELELNLDELKKINKIRAKNGIVELVVE